MSSYDALDYTGALIVVKVIDSFYVSLAGQVFGTTATQLTLMVIKPVFSLSAQ